ncbi:hypothetical protein AVEN_113500-1 [Araneus ventricosus]|uniref:PABS domain-containing protein n=1 Tax=Araneus ventricosus TaxID=182803 RepID=A0A4Y2VIY9_ARAVE|nr:hypothetical protein AVEN_113500-1 [Araneus ventricosus]
MEKDGFIVQMNLEKVLKGVREEGGIICFSMLSEKYCAVAKMEILLSDYSPNVAAYNVPTATKFGLDSFKRGWYSEPGTVTGDQAMSVKVEKILYQGKSKYQDIVIFERYILGIICEFI